MFVVSFNRKTVLKLVVPAFVLCVCAVVVLSCFNNNKSENFGSVSSGDITDSADILEYISLTGWEVNSEPEEIREIIIPNEFNDVYTNYNEIQLEQGFDLAPYKGERVKRWTYTVKNYPGYEQSECVKINLLVYKNAVIGGDVCSVELEGFMHGLWSDVDGEKR